MKKNMGTLDRFIRILLAILIGTLYLAKTITGIAAIVLLVFAIIFLLTALTGFCPLYIPLGVHTLGKKD